MVDPEGKPYVIPMNFGYDGEYIYFHGSATGKKADVLRNNQSVCISFSTDHELRYVNEGVACSWSMRYRSVIAYGTAEFVDDPEDKTLCLNKVMAHYTDRPFTFSAPSIKEVMVFKVRVEKMDGRVYGY
jgi:nitroimidazol reductase NimA-like FMN-containing flavoprotein (pyridoxamine 5'-phosphate oxidase superfamily)